MKTHLNLQGYEISRDEKDISREDFILKYQNEMEEVESVDLLCRMWSLF